MAVRIQPQTFPQRMKAANTLETADRARSIARPGFQGVYP